MWLIVVVFFVAPTGAQRRPAARPSLADQMFAAEDARVSSAAELKPILTALNHNEPRLVAQAVRALGRFERPELVKHVLPLVGHANVDVRAEVANALGQALSAVPRGPEQTSPLPSEAAAVTAALLARLKAETDPYVTGVVAQTLGRLPYASAQAITRTEDAIAAWLPLLDGSTAARDQPIGRVVHPASVTGAVKGLETLIRVNQKVQRPGAGTLERLRATATLGSDPSDADFAFIRRIAWLALNASGGPDLPLIERGLDDPDAQVRRLAVLALATAAGADPRRAALLASALSDPSFIVRYDAVRVYGRTLQATTCAPLLDATDDANAHVALAAVDALGNGCTAGPSPTARLVELADTLQPTNANTKPNKEPEPGTRNSEPGTARAATWHKPAHALVSLARVAPEQAVSRLPRFAEHPTWQVRMYAARAAAALGAAARLERLAADVHDNVREAAVTGLIPLRRHAADAIYLEALRRPDYQLVLTAAKALGGSPNAGAVNALLTSFVRITAEHRDTSRDPRVAVLRTIRELGSKLHAPALQACLADTDPIVAAECAATLQAWTGAPHTAKPASAEATAGKPALRSVMAAPAVFGTRARITMQGGRTFELRLFPTEARATVARFTTLARSGYYNGLTFHRVVPNFVLQGGSPGANEYMGDGAFMRDELGLRTHARGTLGISTRGRDTGDAQIFVNLVDNLRLDHNYTVFAQVSSGMDVVDAILEGDVIERVDVLESPATQSGR